MPNKIKIEITLPDLISGEDVDVDIGPSREDLAGIQPLGPILEGLPPPRWVCPTHGGEKVRERDGRVWCAQKLGDGSWCNQHP